MPRELVFIVEDDDAAREALEALLQTAGYRTEAFALGTAFLESLGSTSGSCVVLDIKMPEMDGLAVQRRLNDSDALLPVVFVTGQPVRRSRRMMSDLVETKGSNGRACTLAGSPGPVSRTVISILSPSCAVPVRIRRVSQSARASMLLRTRFNMICWMR